MSILEAGTRVHIVGIGGAGMSGLAIALAEKGLVVSGCDAAASEVVEELRARGVTVDVGHDARHLRDASVVLWSPAIAADNVELLAGRQAGLTMLSRADALSDVTSTRRVIGFSGTHGKTTTTSMMVHVSLAAGRDDGWLLGAPVLGVGANGHWGDGDLIIELDESYGTFEKVHPDALAVTSVDPDHLDHYGTAVALDDAFVRLVDRTTGPVVVWG